MKKKMKYQTGGLMSYNPYLAAKDLNFQKWYNTNTLEGKNNIPFSEGLDYDYYSYYRNGDYKNYTGGHFPDTYKRPNHETFSDESIYSTPENPGGHWNGNKFTKAKKYQAGGRTPIYTENPNDPRIKNYQDSLNLYTYSKKQQELEGFDHTHEYNSGYRLMTKGNSENRGDSYPSDPTLRKLGDTMLNDNIKWANPYGSPDLFSPTIHPIGFYNSSKLPVNSIFKEPVQPYVYRPASPVQKKTNLQTTGPQFQPRFSDHTPIAQTSNPDLSTNTGAPQANYKSLPQFNYTNPTNYSLTYPIPGNNNQKTMYFPDRDTWKRYNELATGVSSQEGENYGTSTGYLKNGGMNKYQMGSNVPFNIDEWYKQHPEQANYSPQSQIPPDASAPTSRQFNPMVPNGWGLGLMGAYAGTRMLLNKSNDRNYQAYKNRWIRDYNIPSLLQDPDKFSSTFYESPIYQQGGTLEQANQEAKRFAMARNLVSGSNTYVSQIPQYVTPQGNQFKAESGINNTYVPNGVTVDQIQANSQGIYMYPDPQTGDLVPVNSSVLSLPRFTHGRMKSGGIHINPANKGKFTATKKATGKSTEELTHSKNATTRKRAIFAQNAKKWHHQDGGLTMNTPQDQAQGYFAYPNASSLTFPGQGNRTFVPGPFPLMVKDQRGTQIMTNKPIKTYGKVTEMPIYEQGGQVKVAKKVKRADATIEAEKGELIFGAGAPGDVEDQKDRVGIGLYRIGGNSHANGGTPLKAHEGDFVFSKDSSLAFDEDTAKLLVGKEIKKEKNRTPAKLANRYMELNKFIGMTQDEDLDPITKKTAILNINNYIDRLAEIAYAQEQQKGFPSGIPDFVKASLESKFGGQDDLQGDLNTMKMGGQVKKYQQGGVSTSVWDQARKVNKPSPNAKLLEQRGWNSLYELPGTGGGTVNQAIPGGTPGKPWEQFIIDSLQNGVSIDELVKKGHGTPEGLQKYSQYYQPGNAASYEMTSDPFTTPKAFDYPSLDNLAPNIPYNPAKFDLGNGPQVPSQPGLDTFTQIPNSRFNLNTAEAVGLLAAGLPSKSRYPPAFRNYEIQNAKALVASSGRPISEQPYLNSIARANLGYDENNNVNGGAGAARGLGAYQASLEAQNQAISQVYGQNIARQDQRAGQLVQLEVQDGIDRITNAEKYDNKLEMLANNKELESRNRAENVVNLTNQMVRDRQSLSLFNQMSDFYQINPNYSMGLKPTYKIENGKLVPQQRSVGQMIQGTPSSQNQYQPILNLAQSLEGLGYSKDEISKIISKSIDDFDKKR